MVLTLTMLLLAVPPPPLLFTLYCFLRGAAGALGIAPADTALQGGIPLQEEGERHQPGCRAGEQIQYSW